MTDNRDPLNDAEVDFLLQGAEGDTPDDAAEFAGADQAVTMHGDLEQIRLADIFQTFAMSKMQGVLRVRNPLEERQVYCADGYVRVLAPARVTLRRLGQRLICAGLLEPEQLRRALVQQRKERVPLGALLVRDGLVTEREVEELLELQAAEDLFALFTWQHGSFEFFRSERPDAPTPAAFDGCPEYEIHSLLLEVARRSDEWQRILDTIQSLDEVPRRVARPDDPDALDALQRAVLEGADGRVSYRQLADQTTFGLFECARAARDLVEGDLLASLPDADLAALAADVAGAGEPERAVVLLQTLEDRRSELAPVVVRQAAAVLEEIGERRAASSVLLQAGQRAASAPEALELAREAARLAPHDAASLHFLRSVLVVLEDHDPEELEQVTWALVDALVEAAMLPRALEVLAEARAAGMSEVPLLLREARCQQKAKNTDAAIACFLALAEAHLAAGAREKAIEAYQAALRLDGARKDIVRTLVALRRTRAGNVVRWAAAGLAATMVGAMGFVWLDQRHRDRATEQAMTEVQRRLDSSDRSGARRALESWRAELGDCEAVQDLASQVAFAEAAEAQRQARRRRAALTQRMSDAADALARGRVFDALGIYREVHAEAGMEGEVEEIVEQRLKAQLTELSHALQSLLHPAPPDPDELLGRDDVARQLARCNEVVPTARMRAFAELTAVLNGERFDLLAEARLVELREAISQLSEPVAVVRRITERYRQALAQSDVERRLDPMFKEAVAREAEGAFARALELYRTLAEQHTGAAELRAHFRGRVTRNATIVRLLDALSAATDEGDYHAARQHLRELRETFPEVSFDARVQLPLRVQALPPAAEAVVDDVSLGETPVVLRRTPAREVAVTIRAPGFESRTRIFRGDDPEAWTAALTLLPDGRRDHDSAVGAPPTPLPDGDVLVSDRSGCVTRLDRTLQRVRWRFRSDDLSGYLCAPIVYASYALVASLDGTLRALDVASGGVAWELEGLPTEAPPVRIGDRLFVATTDARLHVIDLATRQTRSVDLGHERVTRLMAHGEAVLTLGIDGHVSRWTTGLESRWRLPSDHGDGWMLPFAGTVLLGDDQGRLTSIGLETGEVRWQHDLMEAPLGGAAGDGDAALLAFPDRIVRVRARDGDVQPVAPRGAASWSGPVTRHGERLVCPTNGGTLDVLDRRTGARLYLLPGNEDSLVLPSSGLLFVVDDDHALRSHGSLR